MRPRLEIRRDEDSTVIGYMREDGAYAAVRIADDSDAETIADQLRVLAEAMPREPWWYGKKSLAVTLPIEA
jgi:hypothetical protein